MQNNIWFLSEVRAFSSRIERLLPHLPEDKKTSLEKIISGNESGDLDSSKNLQALLDKWEFLYLDDLTHC